MGLELEMGLNIHTYSRLFLYIHTPLLNIYLSILFYFGLFYSIYLYIYLYIYDCPFCTPTSSCFMFMTISINAALYIYVVIIIVDGVLIGQKPRQQNND